MVSEKYFSFIQSIGITTNIIKKRENMKHLYVCFFIFGFVCVIQSYICVAFEADIVFEADTVITDLIDTGYDVNRNSTSDFDVPLINYKDLNIFQKATYSIMSCNHAAYLFLSQYRYRELIGFGNWFSSNNYAYRCECTDNNDDIYNSYFSYQCKLFPETYHKLK